MGFGMASFAFLSTAVSAFLCSTIFTLAVIVFPELTMLSSSCAAITSGSLVSPLPPPRH